MTVGIPISGGRGCFALLRSLARTDNQMREARFERTHDALGDAIDAMTERA